MQEAEQTRYQSLIEKSAGLLLLAYPTLMLTVKGGMNGAFLLMLLLALTFWITRPAGMATTVWNKEWTIYAVSMVSMTAAIFISQSYHQNYFPHPYDGASRYWLAIPVFLVLRRLQLKIFPMLQYAFPIAAIAGLLLAKDIAGRWGVHTMDLIHFGDFEMMLGALSLFSINWLGHDKLPLRMFKIIGFAAGVSASIASGSRGGWLALPVFLAIFVYFYAAGKSRIVIATTAGILALGSVLLYSFNPTVHQRVGDITYEVSALNQGNQDTSTGVRWQLYKAAVEIFSNHPFFGVGPDGFALEMAPMLAESKITPAAAELGRGEVHNDILCKAAGMGIFGLMAIVCVYLVPIGLFWKASKSVSGSVKRTGILGVVFVSGFFVFGLTVEMLNLTLAIAFYSFTVAALLAFCYNIHHGDPLATSKLNRDILNV